MYARKLPLLQVLKYVPRSIELVTAQSIDAQAEVGQQHLKIEDVRGVIEGMVEVPETPEIPIADAQVVEEFDTSNLMSNCGKHGLFAESLGNCPKCEEGK